MRNSHVAAPPALLKRPNAPNRSNLRLFQPRPAQDYNFQRCDREDTHIHKSCRTAKMHIDLPQKGTPGAPSFRGFYKSLLQLVGSLVPAASGCRGMGMPPGSGLP